MHIVIDARALASSTGTVIERLLHYLQDLDRENRYTVLIAACDDAAWTPRTPNFAKLLVDVPHHSLAEQVLLRAIVRRLQPDLVHYAMPQQPLWTGLRTVTTIYDLIILRERNPNRGRVASWVKRAVGRFAFAQAAARSARVITMAEFTKADLVRTLGVPPAKIEVIPGAAEVTPGALEPFAHPFGRFLLYVGRQPPYKNVAALCDAHQALLGRHPDLGLILVGREDADVRRVRAHCEARGYRNIVFAGYLPDGQRDWLYTQAAAYVFPSLAEGFGLPGLEAMGYGAPVVSSDATCLPEVYGDAAEYFDPRDTIAMTTAIGRVLDDETRRTDLIERGHACFARYSWREAAERTLAVYREVLGS